MSIGGESMLSMKTSKPLRRLLICLSQYDEDKVEVDQLDNSAGTENAAQVQQETRQLISRYV